MVDTLPSHQHSAAKWWRYSKYVVEDGRLRPAPRAKLKGYLPWELYLEAKQSRREGRSPYVSLVKLVWDLDLDKPDYGATPEHYKAIAGWCGRYGLLGILPHRALMISLAPRWQYEEDLGNIRVEDDALIPVLRTYFRASEGWVLAERLREAAGSSRVEIAPGIVSTTYPRSTDPSLSGQLVSTDLVPHWPQPYAVMQELARPVVRPETLHSALGRFFPDIEPAASETSSYPRPCSHEFWAAYAESLADFLEAAIILRRCVETLSSLNRDGVSRTRSRARISEDLQILNLLAGSVRSVLWRNRRGRLTTQLVPSSLLGWLALMAMQDLDAGEFVRTCGARGCGGVFTSGQANAAYCSEKCRNRQKKWNYRHKKGDTTTHKQRKRRSP